MEGDSLSANVASRYHLEDLPPELRCGHFDAVIFSSDGDAPLADQLASVLRNQVIVPTDDPEHGSRRADVCTLSDDGPLCCFQSWFDRLDEALDRSTFSFFLLTRSYKDRDKVWTDIKRDEALMKALEDRRYRNTVVPLHTVPKEERRKITPVGMRALCGISDVDKLLENRHDQKILTKFTELLKQRTRERTKREEALEQKRLAWWNEEKLRKQMDDLSISEANDLNKWSMHPKERTVLTNKHTYLMDNMHDVKDLLDDFIQAGIINKDTAEEIQVKETTLLRKQAFFYKLDKWGPQAYQVFLNSLDRNGHDFVKQCLEEEMQRVEQSLNN